MRMMEPLSSVIELESRRKELVAGEAVHRSSAPLFSFGVNARIPID